MPRRYPGRAATPGTALGALLRTDRQAAPTTARTTAPTTDVAAAFAATAAHLDALTADLRAAGRSDDAAVAEVAALIAADRDLVDLARSHLDAGHDATAAVALAVDFYAGTLEALEDAHLASRAADVRDVGRRVGRVLTGRAPLPAPTGPVVLTGHELSAADLLEAGPHVVGAVSVTGGPVSHAAVVARSLGIPLLVGVDRTVLAERDGQDALVDLDGLTVDPDTDARSRAAAAAAAVRDHRATLAASRHLPTRTRDGREITVRANIATAQDARRAVEAGADGVGLLRTELPFLTARSWPDEAAHAAALAPVFAALSGAVVTVRTLDFTDDKRPPFLDANGPGVHGLAAMLAAPGALAAQFRAVLATAREARPRILLPMIESPVQLARCRAELDAVCADLGVSSPPLGVMVELPEALPHVDALARDADFVSIGTNDLTARLLGRDRHDPTTGPELAAAPVVLGAIAAVAAAARARGRTVCVCGDAAAHPAVVPLLIGLGCDELSVATPELDEVRALVRSLDTAQCAAAVLTALNR